MKTRKIVTAALLLIAYTSSYASDKEQVSDRLVFDFSVDSDNNINPETFIPVPWGTNWFSGLGYNSRNKTEQDSLNGFTDSKLSTNINEQNIRLNILSYQINSGNLSYSIGADYQKTSIDRVEFGYFYLNNGIIDDYIAFDNNINIEVTGFSARGDITYGKSNDANTFRFTAIVSPANTLAVEQNTNFKPIVTEPGLGSSSKSQDLGYNLKLVTKHKLGNFMSVGLDLQYVALPLNYDVKILASTADGFVDSTIDTTETTTRAGLRFIFNYPIAGNMYPVLGIVSEKIEVEDNLNGGTNSLSQTLTTIGFTGRF